MKLYFAICLFILSLPPFAWGGSFLLETASINSNFGPLGGLVAGSAPFGQTQFVGARFTLTATTHLNTIGGHIVGNSSTDQSGNPIATPGSGFVAILQLLGPTAFPTNDPSGLESKALWSTLLHPGISRTDFLVPLSLLLPEGNYAVIFGGASRTTPRLFGANGDVFFGEDFLNSSASIFTGSKTPSHPGIVWQDYTQPLGPRILIAGTPVPEPSTLMLIVSGMLGMLLWRRSQLNHR